MVLMRMHPSLEAQAYLRLQRSMLATLWFDVDSRLKIVGEELKQTLTSQSDLKSMHGLHLQTFLEYDELKTSCFKGFLADDRTFAAAIWRCLYMGRTCDPIHVLRAIAYMRSTIAWLDTLDLNEIMVDGYSSPQRSAKIIGLDKAGHTWDFVHRYFQELFICTKKAMAELPDLGARCRFESCKRLDFLPFTCPLCKCCFCSDHRFVHGCDNSKQYDPSTAVPSSSGPLRGFLCSFEGCSRAESIKIVCPYCERNYCLKHRHADEHSCDSIPEKVQKTHPNITIPTVEPSAKPEKTAAKAAKAPLNPADQKKIDRILIMKLKMNAKATADVPTEERMFLFIEGEDMNGRQAVVVSKVCISVYYRNGPLAVAPQLIKKLLSLDEAKTVQIVKTDSDNPLDYAETASDHLNDMDTVRVQIA
ncbi:AN1-like Zinc finger [Oesophagostomum dentatum]|uniref:AN1-like Zinc finger n=1 Tax=Oesophagostomum dentatum TaxID=61180 RepID=A0A0B1T054_OESDE|nr:AN1-like Zinc finger [Oesophagostomum dentatum]